MYSENTVKNVIKYKMKYDTTKECLFLWEVLYDIQ